MKIVEKSPAVYNYECEKCHTLFANESEALECEKSHIDVIGFTSKKYENEIKYPTSVNIRMADGTKQTYNLKPEMMDDILQNVTANGKTILAIVEGYNVIVQKEFVKDEETIIEKLTGANVKLENNKLYVDIPDDIDILSTDTICVKVLDEKGNEITAESENSIFDEIIITAEIKTTVNNTECIIPEESEEQPEEPSNEEESNIE